MAMTLGVSAGSSINVWSYLIGPVSRPVALLFFVHRFATLVHVFFVLVETVVFRLAIDKFWRRIPPINEDFFALYLIILNPILGLVLSLVHLSTGEGFAHVYRVMGKNIDEIPEPELKLKTPLKIFAVGGLILTVCFVIRHGSNLKTLLNQNRVGQADDDENQDGRRNTRARNQELINGSTRLFLVLAGLGLLVPSMVFTVIMNRDLGGLEGQETVFDLLRLVSASVVMPSIIYAKNEAIRHHALHRLREHLKCCYM